MRRHTGTYDRTSVGGEEVAAFVPFALPPRDPHEADVDAIEPDADLEEVCNYLDAREFARGRADPTADGRSRSVLTEH